MSDDQHDNNQSRSPFSHTFNIGTTIQSVFRNINHAFSNHEASTERANDSRNPMSSMPPLEPSSGQGDAHDTRSTDTANPLSSPTTPIPIPSTSTDTIIPPVSQPDSHQDDEQDSIPDLHSVADSSDSEASVVFNPVPPRPDVPPAEDEQVNSWIHRLGGLHPRGPLVGTRRARVDDDEDNARDRRHPSERVGGSPPGDAARQNTNPQQPRPPAGLFGALFGLGPLGGNRPGGDDPPEHAHAGDPSTADNNATPGQGPRGGPILTAGFTLTIPFFNGPPPGPWTGPPTGAQGGASGMPGIDAAVREDLFATFAAIFQEFQALEEAREDPERAKKLVAGLEVVPLGLVKRLERVGGAPGGHVADANAEGSSSGCAICWDTLLDAESDSFSGQHASGSEAAQPSSSGTNIVEGQAETHAEIDAMEVDAPSVSVSQSEPGTSAPAPLSSEPAKVISLPCAHVFHASCLLPWFTRAKQATCPTCRFNIDPENLTYTPLPRQAFNRAPPAQPDNATPAGSQPAPPEGPDASPVDATRPTGAPRPTATAVPPGQVPTGQAPGGDNPFNIGGMPIPMFTFPAIQIPLRSPAAQTQTPGGDNQGTSIPLTRLIRAVSPSSANEYPFVPVGIDILTIGLDMFIGGGPHPDERGGRDPAQGAADGANRGATGNGEGAADRNGVPNPNGLAQDLHSLIEGLVRTTHNIIPQVVNSQGQGAAPAPDAAPAEGGQPQPQARSTPTPDANQPQPQPGPPPTGGPRVVPIFPFRPNMFRPTRPMPPRRERKTWTLPPAPGPSLRQRVEQREREEGLRCCDTSCGVGPSDDDPYAESSASLTKQVCIRPLLEEGCESDEDEFASVCAHVFHPACLVSAERVAGWGGKDKDESASVEVSCPVCRAVGCVTRDEWSSGVEML